MTLAFDVDGCIADFSNAYKKRLIKVTEKDLFTTDWTPTCWDWDKAAGYTSDEIEATWDSITKDPLFWEKLKPIAGAVETMSRVGMLSKTCPVYFLTNRMGVKCKQGTEKFLYDLGVSYPTVIITADKLPVLKAIRANFFVDDKLETMNQVQAGLRAEHLYLIDTPYNQSGRSLNLKVASDVKDALEKAGLW